MRVYVFTREDREVVRAHSEEEARLILATWVVDSNEWDLADVVEE